MDLIVVDNHAVDVIQVQSPAAMVMQLAEGPPGRGIPPGGTLGQALVKLSSTDYETEWMDLPSSAMWGSITGTLSDQTDLQTALNNLVPYNNASQSVDLGAYSIAAGQLLLNDFTGTTAVGSITTDVDNGVNLTHIPSGINFVGFNAYSSTPYFGSDPTAYGYGVQYSSGILYVTANGGAYAQGFQLDGAGVINGDSSSYVTPFTINDANSADDGSTRVLSVYLTGLGREGLSVDNRGSVYMGDGGSYFDYYGGGYLAGGFTWSSSGQLRVGGGTPAYAYLEAIGASYSHLRMGENDSIFSQITVDGAGGMTIRPSTNNTGTLKVANSSGTALFTVDTSNDRWIGRLGSNDFLFAKGASNITPNFSIGASGGKAVALGSGTSGSFFAYDSTGTFNIGSDTRANLVGGSTNGGTVRLTMTGAGLVGIGGSPTYNLDVFGTTTSYIRARSTSADSTGGLLLQNDIRMWSVEVYGGISTDDFRIYDQTAGAMRLQITGNTGNVGVGVAPTDKFTVGSPTNGTDITMGFRTLTGGGSSIRTIFTQGATTGALSLAVDQGQNGSAREFNLSVGGATNAIVVNGSGNVAMGVAPVSGTRLTLSAAGTNINALNLFNSTGGATDTVAMTFACGGGTGATISYNRMAAGSGDLVFNLSPTFAGALTERMRIERTSGNVTISNGASLGSSTARQIFNANSAAVVFDYDVNASSTSGSTFFRFGNGTICSSSGGISNILSSTPTMNQSSTAGWNALNINVTDTGTSTGAKNLAKLALGGTTMFNVDSAGATTIGAGSAAITKVYTATATLDFGSIGSNSTAALTIAVTGAAIGDAVFLGAPSGLETDLTFSGYVSATDTVTVRLHNASGGSIDPASATWRATVIKF